LFAPEAPPLPRTLSSPAPYTLHPTPYTLHDGGFPRPTPYTDGGPTPHAPTLKKCGEIDTVFVHKTELYSPLISDILNGINKRIVTVIN